jgi:Ca-activated chloride channel family protein
MRKAVVIIALFLCVLLCASSVSKAQDQTLKVDVNLVLVNATVSDLQGRLVAGLGPSNFHLTEDGVEQKLEHFSVEDLPLSVGLIFDTTGSMADKLSAARNAATAFLKTSNPRDEYFLIKFSDEPRLVEDFTTDLSRLQKRIFSTSAQGLTPLFDAVQMGLEKIKSAKNTKKALLVITDGEDNHSQYTFSDIREFTRHQDVQIYAIGLINSATGQMTIRDLVETTGGRAFFPNSVTQLQDICTRIAIELKNQYLLGYRSTDQRKDGKWREIHLEVDPPKGLPPLKVRAKTGYYAATSYGTKTETRSVCAR